MTQRTQQTQQTEPKIVWVHLQKDYAFILRDEAVEGRLTKRAIASIQRRVKDALIAETSDLSRASASFKVLTLPNSRSFFLRKEKQRNYEVPAQQQSLFNERANAQGV